MSVNKTIREGRKRLGMSEQQFAVAVGVTRGAVQQWEKSNGTAPKRITQPLVAKVLGITVAELMTGSNVSGANMPREVPLVSDVEAGRYTVIDNFKPKKGKELEMVPTHVEVKRHTFALRVQGDSMTAEGRDSFPEGCILIVEPQMASQPGDFVIAMNIDGETTFKLLVKDAGELYLKPLNPRYPIKPLGTGKVVGVVREFSKRFR